MAIHAATLKKAVKAGIEVFEKLDHLPDRFQGLQPSSSDKFGASYKEYALLGSEIKYLLDDMYAIVEMTKNYPSFDLVIARDSTCTIEVKGTDIEVTGKRPNAAFIQAKSLWMESRAELDVEDEEADQEAQAEIDEEIEEEGKLSGSVVGEKYRAKYAEAGHPTHCGDWLAETLNNLTVNKEGSNLELFEAICAENGVYTSKYKRSGTGWQGRIRMTGRNMMAKRVFENGYLLLPEGLGVGEPLGGAFADKFGLKADSDWMAGQRYKRAQAASAPPAPAAPAPVPAPQAPAPRPPRAQRAARRPQ